MASDDDAATGPYAEATLDPNFVVDLTSPSAGPGGDGEGLRSSVGAESDATAEMWRERPWSPPKVLDRRPLDVDRPSTGSDAAAWDSPDAHSADSIPATDQETGHARQSDQ